MQHPPGCALKQPDNVALAATDPFQPDPNDKYIDGIQTDDVRAIIG